MVQRTCFQRFVDREEEFKSLSTLSYGDFAVVYGRRRIGKTRLIREWLKGKRHIYYYSQLSTHEVNLNELAKKASIELNDPLIANVRFKNLKDLLEFISIRMGEGVIVIDELGFWIRSESKVLSELQEFVDLVLPRTNVILIVTSSLMSVFIKRVLSGGSLLYARAKVRLRLEELSFPYVKEFAPNWSSEDRVRLYAAVGGIPFYLCLVEENLDETLKSFLGIGGPLRDEKDLLLAEEFKEPGSYSAILFALAKGYRRVSEIAQVTGLDKGLVSKYLSTLETLGYVKRERLLFGKRSLYKISDPVLRFWYSCIEENLELLEIEFETGIKKVRKCLEELVPFVWEELVAKEMFKDLSKKGYTKFGRVIKGREELDAVFLNEAKKKVIVLEAKWSELSDEEYKRVYKETLRKALTILPKEYEVERVVIACLGNEKCIRPQDLEA